ncbi:hypothetical protein [Serratia fonticola]|uniref:hypothetical protein n=1 Tax=Serratia fonticola TaxID=47917 RepID=UPI0021AD799B|nr:hypothetical protein [Serratia fonticola]
MDILTNNVIRSTAKDAIKEYSNPSNTLTYRQILDKHAQKVAHMLPKKFPAWMWVNYA